MKHTKFLKSYNVTWVYGGKNINNKCKSNKTKIKRFFPVCYWNEKAIKTFRACLVFVIGVLTPINCNILYTQKVTQTMYDFGQTKPHLIDSVITCRTWALSKLLNKHNWYTFYGFCELMNPVALKNNVWISLIYIHISKTELDWNV